MRASLFISLLLHGAILAAALISFTSEELPSLAPTPITVSVVTPSDVTAIKAGKHDGKADQAAKQAPPPVEKPAPIVDSAAKLPPAEKQSLKQAALPPPKASTPPPQPAPEKAQTETRPLETKEAAPPEQPAPPQPPAKSASPAKPRQEAAKREQKPTKKELQRERREAREKRQKQPDHIAELLDKPPLQSEGKSEFDPNKISALLNRDPTAGGSFREAEPREPWRKPSSLEDQANGMTPEQEEHVAYGATEGRDSSMSASEIDYFRSQISRCWTPPVGGLGGEAIIVKLRITLKEDGSLTRPPEVSNQLASPFFRPAADSAVRAVMQCQPYRMPPEKYAQWRDMLLTFDPRQMYGG